MRVYSCSYLFKSALLIAFCVLIVLGCSDKDAFFPKARVVVQAVNPYLYYPGVKAPFSQVEILLNNQLGIPASLHRVSITYHDQYNRDKLVMVNKISSAYDLFLQPLQVTSLQLTPIEQDFFDQLALLDPPAAILAAGKESLTDSEELTAQEFPVLGKISMTIDDANGNNFSVDAHVLIHYLGDIPDTATGTGTGTGTGTNTGTGTDTGKDDSWVKIERPVDRLFKMNETVVFYAESSSDINTVNWMESVKDSGSKVFGDYQNFGSTTPNDPNSILSKRFIATGDYKIKLVGDKLPVTDEITITIEE